MTTTPSTATPMNAAVASAALNSSPSIVSRKTAMIGNARFMSWFQRPTRVTARATSRAGKPQRRVIPYEPAIPTAAPPGNTSDSAVDACVSSIARTKPSPGSAIIHGGANVARLMHVATTSATIHGHDRPFTTCQTSA